MADATPAPIDTSNVAAQLQQRPQSGSERTIFDEIKASEGALARALPNIGVTPERFARLVTTEIRRNKRLAACTSGSILGAMMYSAQLGLEPGPLQRAYLVPYGREATLIIGYRGMIELARRSGEIVQLEAREVCAEDEFEFDLGDTPYVHHKWDVRKARGPIVAYYGLAVFKGGGKFILPVSLDQIEARRKHSRAADSGPWKENPVPMSLKTVIRMMEPWLPLTSETAEAFQTDERVRVFNPLAATPEDAIKVAAAPAIEESGAGGDAAGGDGAVDSHRGTDEAGPPASDETPRESDPAAHTVDSGDGGEGEPLSDDGGSPPPELDAESTVTGETTFAPEYDQWPKERLIREAKAREADLPTSGKTILELASMLRGDDTFTGRTATETSE